LRTSRNVSLGSAWSCQEFVDSKCPSNLVLGTTSTSTTRGVSHVQHIYKFIQANQEQHSVELMCKIFGVAWSGFYAWLKSPLSKRAEEDARLLRLIRASFDASHVIYSAPREFLDLRKAGETCSKHRMAGLLREHGLRALHGYRTRRIPVSRPSALIPNLL